MNGMQNALHPEKSMPPLTNFFEKEVGDESDSDDELEIGGQTQDYKCPITLSLLKDPLTAYVLPSSPSRSLSYPLNPN